MGMMARLKTPLILIGLFIAAWAPRVVALDAFVTPDERKWLTRAANFYYALAHGDFAGTFQHEHPGVTVMWAGMLALLQKFPEYAQKAPGYFTWNEQTLEAWLKTSTSVTPLELLTAGRWWIVLGVAVLLALAFLPLRRLLGDALAVLALLFVAWMPWAVGLSRQLHPDGYVSSLIFVALVFFLSWLYTGRRWRDLVASGILMGLAWLTKTPAAFLVPVGAVLIAIEVWRGLRRDRHAATSVKALLLGYVVWGVVASAVFILLWPSMWVDPLGTFARIQVEMTRYVGGHENPNFFMGQATNDPGLFFYPVAYVFRSTPGTLIGLLVAALAAWRRWPPFDRPLVRRTALGLLIFAVGFLLLMSIPAKKFDRYLLPSFLALDVLAALGWAALALWVAGRLARVKRAADAGNPPPARRTYAIAIFVVLIGVAPLHGLFTVLHYPYYITYFNPLVGGSRTAPQVLFMGWGEGLDQAAAWLNQQPDAEKRLAVSGYAPGPLSYYFQGTAMDVLTGSAVPWLVTDYVVLYANQIQRDLPTAAAVNFLLAQTPVQTITLQGMEMVRIYDMHTIIASAYDAQRAQTTVPLTTTWPHWRATAVNTLLDVRLGEVLPIDIQFAGDIAADLKVSVRLQNAEGALIAQRDVALGEHVAVQLFVPPDAVAGAYNVVVLIYNEETLDPVGDVNGQLEVVLAPVQVMP